MPIMLSYALPWWLVGDYVLRACGRLDTPPPADAAAAGVSDVPSDAGKQQEGERGRSAERKDADGGDDAVGSTAAGKDGGGSGRKKRSEGDDEEEGGGDDDDTPVDEDALVSHHMPGLPLPSQGPGIRAQGVGSGRFGPRA